MEIKLTHLAQLLGQCWNAAERETARLIAEKYHAPNEENLTFLFSGELRALVENASATRQIESAFLKDLRSSIPNLPERVARYARGLLARVTFHGRRHEGYQSGADLGLVITRPLVTLSSDHVRVQFRRDRGTGLLAQAKLGCPKITGEMQLKWGRLTAPQARKFSKHSDYYSLLLYRLLGPERSELQEFGWQLSEGRDSAAIQGWLASDAFPDELSSSTVLGRLFAHSIGTEDPKVLASIVDPAEPSAHAIELHISWPDGAGPPSSVWIEQEQRHQQQIHLRVKA
jgi:hypothetical protein